MVFWLSVLVVGMWFIGYLMGRIEERHKNEFIGEESHISNDADISKFIMEMEQRGDNNSLITMVLDR